MRQTMTQVMIDEELCRLKAMVHQSMAHRIENIRGFADRDNPNREEIVSLCDELKRELKRIADYNRP
jgi:hypothetical protein